MSTGPFRRSTRHQVGLSQRGLTRALAEAAVVQPLRGVYLFADDLDDFPSRLAALGLAMPTGAVACRLTAAWAWGVDARAPGGEHRVPVPLQCVVPPGRTVPRRRGVQGFVADVLDEDVTELGGVLLTTPARTALDLARWCRPHVALASLDTFTRHGLLDPVSLLPRIERLSGHRYIDQARTLVRLVDPGAESPGESWLRLRLVQAGFPPPESQVSIRVDGREVWRLDLGWPDRRVGVEYDGDAFHGSSAQQERDRRRREDLRKRFGWEVHGVGRGDVLGSSMALEDAVGQLLGIVPAIARRPW